MSEIKLGFIMYEIINKNYFCTYFITDMEDFDKDHAHQESQLKADSCSQPVASQHLQPEKSLLQVDQIIDLIFANLASISESSGKLFDFNDSEEQNGIQELKEMDLPQHLKKKLKISKHDQQIYQKAVQSLLKGVQTEQCQQYEKAIIFYQQVEKLYNKSPQLYYRMAYVCFKLQRIDQAQKWRSELAKLDPMGTQSLLILRRKILSQIDKRCRYRQAMLNQKETQFGWFYQLIRKKMNCQMLIKTIFQVQFEHFRAHKPDKKGSNDCICEKCSDQLLSLLITVTLEYVQKRIQEAEIMQNFQWELEVFSKEQKKDIAETLFKEGIRCQQSEKYKRSIKYYQLAEYLDKSNPKLYQRMAHLCLNLDDIKQAKKWLQKLKKIDPIEGQSLLALEIYRRQQINKINQAYRRKQQPHIPNPWRIGRKNYFKQKIINQPNLKNQKSNTRLQPKQLYYSYNKTSQNLEDTLDKKNLSAKRKDIDGLKSQTPVKIQNPLQYPQSTVGFIISEFKAGKKRGIINGTGCLIGPNIVVTAAHNVYFLKEEVQSIDIQFFPAANFPRVTVYRARKCFFPIQFKKKRDYPQLSSEVKALLFDYAFIQLDTEQNLQTKYGSLSYDFNWQQTTEYLKRQGSSKKIENLTILGFLQKNLKQFELTKFKGEAFVDNYYLIYKQPTTNGTSGSANIEFVDGQYFLRGIHVRDVGKHTNVKNAKAGLQLRSDMFVTLQKNFTYFVNQYNLTWYITMQKQPIISNKSQIKSVLQYISIRQSQARNKIKFNFNDRQIGPQGCKHLASAKWLNLLIIELAKNSVGDEGCRYLASAQWPDFQAVNLFFNSIGNEGCRHLASAQWLNLQTIYLSFNEIGDDGCRYLAAAQWHSLQTLNIRSNKIESKGCKHLASAHQWPNLQTLNLQGNNIGDEGCRHLVSSQWRNLETVNLGQNKIGSEGCRHLISTKWVNLLNLKLSFNKIGDQGCKYITSARWPKLLALSLKDNKIGNNGLRYLVQAQSLNLRQINLHGNNISAQKREYLKRLQFRLNL